MSSGLLESYTAASRDLQDMAVGMSAEDIKENTKFVLESAQINEIPESGKINLRIDQDGVAHIPVAGMLTNTVTPSAAFEGKSITTYNFITESTKLAEQNTAVNKIRYNFNTGGGEVDGMEPAVHAIKSASKPTEAYVFSSAQSAGILLASQTDKIVATGKMSMLGSVGVAAEFKDRTEAEEKEGTKRIILSSTDAPNKRLDIKTDKGQQATIKLMDEVHAVMVGYIADGRGTTPDFVNKNYGRGGTMTAEKALEVGMIDEILGVPARSNSTGGKMAASSGNSTIPVKPEKNEEKLMNLAEFLAQGPEHKAEFEKAVLAESEKALTLHKQEHAAVVAKVGPIVMSESYGAAIKNAGLKVMSGEKDYSSFEDLVALSDEMTEKSNSEAIQQNQPDATPGDPGYSDEQTAEATTTASAKALADSINKVGEVE